MCPDDREIEEEEENDGEEVEGVSTANRQSRINHSTEPGKTNKGLLTVSATTERAVAGMDVAGRKCGR